MTEKIENNILGFYASFNFGETDSELIRSYLWSENGLKNKFKSLKWHDFGTDLKLILFEIYVRPIAHERKNIKPIGNYRRKEQSVGIPIILDDNNFFGLEENERELYFKNTILEKLELLTEKIKRNKLDTNITELKRKVRTTLNE
jgi:hypothetical protein